MQEFMQNRLFLIVFAILTLMSPGKAQAEETPLWGYSGNWEIRVDPTLDYSCFALIEYKTGTILRIGFNKSEDNYYLVFGHPDWTSIEEGKTYEITLRMDKARPWTATLEGVWLGKTPGLIGSSQDIKFIKEFVRKRSMRIYFEGRQLDHISLTGSRRAFETVITCQDKIDEAMKSSTGPSKRNNDPFATKSNRGRKKDPFAK